MRERRRVDPRMSSRAGKRVTGWRGNGQPPTLAIRFTPRPHVNVRIRHRYFDALIDTGSEVSFINQRTARAIRALEFTLQREEGTVQLANGQTVKLPGRVRVPVGIAGRRVWHSFFVMPTLGSTMLLGIDFWAKIGHALPAPPPPARSKVTPAAAAAEGLNRRTWEEPA